MAKHPDITLGFILEQHKKNPKDKKLHRIIERGRVGKKSFVGFLKKIIRRVETCTLIYFDISSWVYGWGKEV